MSDREGPKVELVCDGCRHLQKMLVSDAPNGEPRTPFYRCKHPKMDKGAGPGMGIGYDTTTPTWCPLWPDEISKENFGG